MHDVKQAISFHHPSFSPFLLSSSDEDDDILCKDETEIPLLNAGSHTFTFKFRLPNESNLPCSFECGKIACIRYFVQANMDISWAVDPVAERFFSFIGSPINCNQQKFLVSGLNDS